MKQPLIKSILVILCGFFAHQSMAATTSQHQPMDRIVATINDAALTQSELTTAMNTLKQQMANSQMTLPPDADLRKQVLDQLVNRKLQSQLAEQSGVSASEEDVDRAVKQIAMQNNISIAEVYQKISSQGLSKADYRKEIRDEIILQKIQGQEVAAKITVTPQEVNDFMRGKAWQAANNKEYHLQDILIGLPDEPTSQQITTAKQHAENILSQIHHGMNFNQAAMAESNNSSALKGGDLGWRKLPEIPTAFADQVIQMKEKDIIGPLQTQNGFHIIFLDGVRNVNTHLAAATQQKQVEQLVFQRKLEEGLQNWVMKLRSSATINLNPETASSETVTTITTA